MNDAPTASDVSSVTNEDESVVIGLIGDDIDSSQLSYTANASEYGGTINIDGSLATYTPPLDFSGIDTFVYTVSDGDLSAIATVTLTVAAVNDAPTLAAVNAVTFAEDGSSSTTLSCLLYTSDAADE